jgi:hypothetical protein
MKNKLQGDGGVNVTEIDLGEKVSETVRMEVADQIRMAGKEKARGANVTSSSRTSRFSGGYRPGMYGGYRPSWANRFSSGLGAGNWKLGEILKLPANMRETGKDLLVGGLVGTVANRVVAWVVPGLVKTQSKLATDAIGFAVGLIPYLVKQNAMTVGVALPGLFFLAGSLTEWAIGKTNLLGAKPALSGPQPVNLSGGDAVLAARRKLAEVQARIAQARQQAGVPRVVAQRVA